jgi:hypothetical protein
MTIYIHCLTFMKQQILTKMLWGLIAALAIALPATISLAQSQPQFDTLGVALWPEFDRADVLVVYHVSLNPNSVPAQVTFQLPGYIEEMFAVAVEKDGGLLNVPPDQISMEYSGDYLYLSFPASEPNIQFEYYDPFILTKDGITRQLDYRFTAPYAVNSVTFEIQQPVGAQDFAITPAANNSFTGSNGLTYSGLETGSLNAGDAFEISASYQRTTNALSVDALPDTPPASMSAPAPQPAVENTASSVPSYIAYGLIGVGVLLLVGTGARWWMQNRRSATEYSSPAPRRRPNRPKAAKKPTKREPVAVQSAAQYCYNCGSALRSDANFCHACGAARR